MNIDIIFTRKQNCLYGRRLTQGNSVLKEFIFFFWGLNTRFLDTENELKLIGQLIGGISNSAFLDHVTKFQGLPG